MPSGARKRKAAKKKKEKVAPTSSTNPSSATSSTQGDEYLKHRESEGAAEEEGVVQIERESKEGDGFDNKKGSSSSTSSSSSSGSDDESPAVENDLVVIENVPVADSVEVVHSLAEGPSQVTHSSLMSKLDASMESSVCGIGAEKISLLEEKVLADSGASADDSLSSSLAESKENGETKLNSVEENARIPEVGEDLAPKEKNDAVTNASATSESKESAANENDSEVLGSSQGQPLVPFSAPPVQTNSWKSCCGLLEVFTGTNR